MWVSLLYHLLIHSAANSVRTSNCSFPNLHCTLDLGICLVNVSLLVLQIRFLISQVPLLLLIMSMQPWITCGHLRGTLTPVFAVLSLSTALWPTPPPPCEEDPLDRPGWVYVYWFFLSLFFPHSLIVFTL